MLIENVELLGVLGLTWQEHISKVMYEQLKNVHKESAANVKKTSFINMIYNFYLQALAGGVPVPDGKNNNTMIQSLTKNNVLNVVAKSFVDNLQKMVLSGSIDYKILDPKGSAKIKKDIESVKGKSAFDGVLKSGNKLFLLAALSAGAIGLFYINNILQLRKRL